MPWQSQLPKSPIHGQFARLQNGETRASMGFCGLLFWDKYVGCAGDAGGLHVALNMRLQRADLEVAEKSPTAWAGDFLNPGGSSFYLGRQSGRFAVEGSVTVRETLAIAVDTIQAVRTDGPQADRWGSLACTKPRVGLEATGCKVRRLAGFIAVVFLG